MLSPLDDYPIHQVPEVIRHTGTSDRNFYDRYYFNAYNPDLDTFLIMGLGQYPNLGVTDAFALLRQGDDHIVVRASKELGSDRMDTTVGPLRIEVLEGLQQLRFVLEAGNGLDFDLTFTGNMPATLEARHFKREMERVFFDSVRFAQTGHWAGVLNGQTINGWKGNRDRSWGIRPVGESEAGRKAANPQPFFWIYSVMQFPDYTIIVITQEEADGRRVLEEAVRVRPDGTHEWLGRPEHMLEFAPESRDVTKAQLTFHKPATDALTIDVELILPSHLGVGTGYGHLEPEWRHGLWQGPELEVQSLTRKASEIDLMNRMFCPTDHLARFQLSGRGETATGTGLFEVAVIGAHAAYGFESFLDTAATEEQ